MSKSNNKRKYNVLQVVPALDCGGVERGTLDISKSLANSGNKSFILTKGGRLENSLDNIDNISTILRDVSTKNPFKIWRNISFIEDVINQNNIDIVHARSRAPAWSSYYACKKTNTRFITTFHGVYGLKSNLKKVYNSVMVKGDKVIAVSNFIKRHVMEHYNVDESKIEVIYRGVDLEYFDPKNLDDDIIAKTKTKYHVPDSTPIILLPSRMTEWKGQEYLVKALNLIKDLDFYCILVGDLSKHPGYVARVNNLILENKLQSKVRVFGSDSDILNLYNISDIVISSSIEPEAFGRTVVEAQAMKKMVVATKIGGVAETVTHEKNGFHVNPRDENDLADKIKYALSILNSKKSEEICNNARDNVERNFSLDKMQSDTLKLYSGLI